MEKKVIILSIVALVIFLAAIGYYKFSIIDHGGNPDSYERNSVMENTIKEIINQVLIENNQSGNNISIGSIEIVNRGDNGKIEGSVKFKCNSNITGDSEEIIISKIANKLFTEYPEQFGENSTSRSEISIIGCSTSSSSPDGINAYPHQTRWGIFKGHYDFAI